MLSGVNIMNSLPLATNSQGHTNNNFNLGLIGMLFSDPQRDRANAIVVSNHEDITANIKALDLLRIDFTDTKLSEGLYVITLDDGWVGFRYFFRMPTLHMRDSTDCYPVTLAMLNNIKVIGKVKDIYRSSHK